MEYCKKCVLYQENLDKMGQRFEDVKPKGRHYCVMFRSGIPEGIVEDKESCKYHIEEKNGELHF